MDYELRFRNQLDRLVAFIKSEDESPQTIATHEQLAQELLQSYSHIKEQSEKQLRQEYPEFDAFFDELNRELMK
jgi:hypothetical protein